MKGIYLSGLDDLKTNGDKLFPDLPTMIIQLIATFILVLILAKFLVKPAKNFIAKRKEYIESNLKDAEMKQKLANEKLLEAQQSIKTAKIAKKEMIEEAKKEALNEKDRILKETALEIKDQKAMAVKQIASERKQMQEDLSHEVIDIAMVAASKIVNREINESDNEKMIEEFLKEDFKP